MLFSAFILGLLGSLHCIGMCGPIAFMLPVDRSNALKKLSQIFVYHVGRLLSYSLIGLVFGIIGKSLYIFGFQQQLTISIGVIMILVVVIPDRFFSKYQLSKPLYRLISKVKTGLGSALKRKTADTFLTIGFLNGFLPCGLVYIALLGAIASTNALDGSLYMAIFGMGTIPLMTTVIYFSQFIQTNTRRKIQKSIPVLVVLIGILFIIRGLGLGIPYLSPTPIYDIVEATIDCH